MFAGTALSVRLLVYAGLSLFIINGPYVFMVVCVVYAYNLTTGELPQLLQYVKSHTTPTPTPTSTTPVKQEMKEEQEQEPMDVGAVKSKVIEKSIIEKPIHISLGGGKQ